MAGSLRIAIVGGGIGGLTAALALRARGVDANVFEQAEAVREIGAGVSIHPNAARLLKGIGLDDQLRNIGSPINGMTLRSSKGEAITTPAGPATPAFSQQTGQGYNVHRADFLNLLFAALPDGTVKLGHRCVQLKEDSDVVRLAFANGAVAEADGASTRGRLGYQACSLPLAVLFPTLGYQKGPGADRSLLYLERSLPA